MNIAWLQPWLHRRQALGAHLLAVPEGRWPFKGRSRLGETGVLPEPSAPRPHLDVNSPERVPLSLRQHLDVNLATAYLQHQLDCDDWHVAGRHDHQLVVQLTRGGAAKYCVT